ncbi:hypothetical protein DE146DRAFT_640156 [Phaeosphaeria sp. MPI-PUGE-AT-0046c]|nr:hypothetical protein DE146DRAFT_640156 [Phaeosphaeria sp. MPI-PUGE-AT-0046c]
MHSLVVSSASIWHVCRCGWPVLSTLSSTTCRQIIPRHMLTIARFQQVPHPFHFPPLVSPLQSETLDNWLY